MANLIAELKNQSGSITLFQEPKNRNTMYWAVSEGITSKITGKSHTTTRKVDRFPNLIKDVKMHFSEWDELELVTCHKFERDIRNSQLGDKTYYNSQLRILDLFLTLQREKKIDLKQAVLDYGSHKETIKEDIYKMREVLEDDFIDIKLIGEEVYGISASDRFTVGDAFALLLMIYHNRSLNLHEIKTLQDKIIRQFTKKEQIKLRNFFQNYQYHYSEHVSRDILPDIETIFQAVQQKQLVTFTYHKLDGASKERKVEPLTLILHDKAYYLVGNEITNGKLERKNFVLDRCHDLQMIDENFSVEDGPGRFEPGKYANEAFYMFNGELKTVRLKMKNYVKPYFIRRFPSGRIISERGDEVISEVVVRGFEGILFWILSQRDHIEVVQPVELREELKETLTKMLKIYTD